MHNNETGEEHREYLRLTYAESSYMEYPKEWENRMNIWNEAMNELRQSA